MILKFGFGASGAMPPGAIVLLGLGQDDVPLCSYTTSKKLLNPEKYPSRDVARRYYSMGDFFPSGAAKAGRDNVNLQGGVQQE